MSKRDKPIWDVIADITKDVPPDELAKLPRDGATNHDAYLYGKEPPMEPITDAEVTLLRLALDKSIGHWGELAYMLPELIARIESDAALIGALAEALEELLVAYEDSSMDGCIADARERAEKTLAQLAKEGEQ